MGWRLAEDEHRRFEEDGYLIVPSLLSAEETACLRDLCERDAAVGADALERRDGSGEAAVLTVRKELKDDMYSAVARSERVVRAMEAVQGGEVYN